MKTAIESLAFIITTVAFIYGLTKVCLHKTKNIKETKKVSQNKKRNLISTKINNFIKKFKYEIK